MIWSKQSIEWFTESAKRSSFHKELAKVIRPHLSKDDVVADIGCGLGYLSEALVPYVKQVYALDQDPLVLDCLKKRTQKVTSLSYTWPDALPIATDVIIMSFFGHLLKDPSLFLHREEKLILIKNVARSASAKTRERVDDIEKLLNSQKRSYQLIKVKLRFDQYLYSKEEALEFFQHYKLDPVHMPAQYPSFLKKEKNLGIFILESKEKK